MFVWVFDRLPEEEREKFMNDMHPPVIAPIDELPDSVREEEGALFMQAAGMI